MTDVIVAQNCPRCGAEPKVMLYGVGIGCPYCADMFAMPKLTETYEDVIIEWNKLGILNCSIAVDGKTYIEADVLIEWLDKRIDANTIKTCLKDENGKVTEWWPDMRTPEGEIYYGCKRRVEKMVRGLRLKDGVEE